jgi:hypothetical protein
MKSPYLPVSFPRHSVDSRAANLCKELTHCRPLRADSPGRPRYYKRVAGSLPCRPDANAEISPRG